MPILSQEELKNRYHRVARAGRVHLFADTSVRPRDQQDPIRLKNLLKQAESQLITEGSRPYGIKPEEVPGKQLRAAVYRF